MPTNDNNAIKCNQGEKPIKLPFVVYTDLECLLEKMSTCYNNPEESSTTKLINILRRVMQYFPIAHSINQTINSIIIEVKIA